MVIEGNDGGFGFGQEPPDSGFERHVEPTLGIPGPAPLGKDVNPVTCPKSLKEETKAGLVKTTSSDDWHALAAAEEPTLEPISEKVGVVCWNPPDRVVADGSEVGDE
jgi:hypothetical protein